MSKYKCGICGFVYDEDAGIPDKGIPAGTKWTLLPADWECPVCGAPKSAFAKVEEAPEKTAVPETASIDTGELRQMTAGELSALCSGIALGCDKQQLTREKELFGKLSNYFLTKAETKAAASFDELIKRINDDLSSSFAAAETAADEAPDRGAKRVLVWSKKVSMLLNSVIGKYKDEGVQVLAHTKIWVCDICGFIYIGETPPAVCPVCKVPSFKILQVERG